MKSLLLVLAGVLSAVPVAAQAQGFHENALSPGFYAGGTLGQSKLRITSPGLDGSGNSDETGFKLIGGYRFNPHFSLETAYYNPGQFSESEDGATLRLKTNIFQFSAVGEAPIAGPVSVFVRAGAAYYDAKLTASDGFNSGSLTETGTEFNWGFGVNVAASERVNLRFEFDESKIDAPIGTMPLEWRLRFLQLGVTYTF